MVGRIVDADTLRRKLTWTHLQMDGSRGRMERDADTLRRTLTWTDLQKDVNLLQPNR